MDSREEIVKLLGGFTLQHARFAQKDDVEELSDRDFFIKLFEQKLDTNEEVFKYLDWTDEFLRELVILWMSNNGIVDRDSEQSLSLHELRSALLDYVHQMSNKFSSSMKAIDIENVNSIMRELAPRIEKAVNHLPLMDERYRTSLAIESKEIQRLIGVVEGFAEKAFPQKQMLDSLDRLIKNSRLQVDSLAIIQRQFAEIPRIDPVLLADLRLPSDMAIARFAAEADRLAQLDLISSAETATARFAAQLESVDISARIAEMSTYTGAALANLTSERIGALIHLDQSSQQHLVRQLADVGQAYSSYAQKINVLHNADLGSVPPMLESSQREIFATAEFVNAISVSAKESLYLEERQGVTAGLEVEVNADLLASIEEIDPEFAVMLVGGLQALESDNADRIRHFSVSVRQTFLDLIKLLAPDDEIRTWTSDPAMYVGNKIKNGPTRKAQLLYISRNVNSGTFQKFLEKDIETIIELIKILNEGTHENAKNWTPSQILSLKFMVQSKLLFLAEISKCNH